jgi:hypothetical protein
MPTLLFLGTNPSDTSRLALDREVREITHRLRATPHGAAFEVAQEWAVRVDDLQACLLRHAPDLVHVSGHGLLGGRLVLEDDRGKSATLGPDALAGLFRILSGKIRCVVLNACFSDGGTERVARHIECVVGMTDAVKDASAIAFAGAFYQALGFGRSVQEAHELGKNQIDLKGLGQTDVPRLVCRAGVDAVTVRLVGGDAEDRPAPSTPAPTPAPAPPPGKAPPRRLLATLALLLAGVGMLAWMRRDPDPEPAAAKGTSSVAAILPPAPATAAPRAIEETATSSTPASPVRHVGTAVTAPVIASAPSRVASPARPPGATDSAPSDPSPGKTVVRTGEIRAGDKAKIRIGNRSGGGSVDVQTKSITAETGSEVDVGNVTLPAGSDAGASITVQTKDVRASDGGTVNIGNTN